MRKRSSHINKALAQIRELKNEKEHLKQQLDEKDSKIKELVDNYSRQLFEMDEKVRSFPDERLKKLYYSLHNQLQH